MSPIINLKFGSKALKCDDMAMFVAWQTLPREERWDVKKISQINTMAKGLPNASNKVLSDAESHHMLALWLIRKIRDSDMEGFPHLSYKNHTEYSDYYISRYELFAIKASDISLSSTTDGYTRSIKFHKAAQLGWLAFTGNHSK
jgi:hypothetical protein